MKTFISGGGFGWWLDYPFGGKETLQMYGKFEGFPQLCIVWVGNMTCVVVYVNPFIFQFPIFGTRGRLLPDNYIGNWELGSKKIRGLFSEQITSRFFELLWFL